MSTAVSDENTARRERVLASIELEKSVIKHLSLELISKRSRGCNTHNEDLWRKRMDHNESVWRERISELIYDMMHNSIYLHQQEHPEEPPIDYENKAFPFAQEQSQIYNTLLTSLIDHKVCSDGVITPSILRVIDDKLMVVSFVIDRHAATLVAESVANTTAAHKKVSKELNPSAASSFAVPSANELVYIKMHDKGRV